MKTLTQRLGRKKFVQHPSTRQFPDLSYVDIDKYPTASFRAPQPKRGIGKWRKVGRNKLPKTLNQFFNQPEKCKLGDDITICSRFGQRYHPDCRIVYSLLLAAKRAQDPEAISIFKKILEQGKCIPEAMKRVGLKLDLGDYRLPDNLIEMLNRQVIGRPGRKTTKRQWTSQNKAIMQKSLAAENIPAHCYIGKTPLCSTENGKYNCHNLYTTFMELKERLKQDPTNEELQKAIALLSIKINGTCFDKKPWKVNR